MKTIVNLVLGVFAFSVVAAVPVESNTNNHLRVQEIGHMVENKTCGLNICFALDGSASLKQHYYELQKEFVLITANVVVNEVNRIGFAAVQYGKEITPISSLTQDIDQFSFDIFSSVFRASSRTSIGKGITYCSDQLSGLGDGPAIIVVFSDGIDDSNLDSASLATSFKDGVNPTGRLYTVGVGTFPNKEALERIATAGGGSLFMIDQMFDVVDQVKDFFIEACGSY